MSSTSRNYAVHLGSAWPGDTGPSGEQCFTIDDPDQGMRFSIFVEGTAGKQRITKLAIMPMREGAFLDQKDLDRIPLARFAKLVAEQFGTPSPTQSTRPLTTHSRLRQERPDPEEVAAYYKNGWGREDFAREFGVSPTTADDWIRGARDRNLIPPSKTGRPRKLRPTNEVVDEQH